MDGNSSMAELPAVRAKLGDPRPNESCLRNRDALGGIHGA
jgi:hypothetical protein